jgi:predicted phosphate transport protein (TIGR00153 family)
LEDTIQQLDQVEHDADEAQAKIIRKLFSIESELPPVSVIFLYRIIDRIGELADRAQQVGERMQQLLAH